MKFLTNLLAKMSATLGAGAAKAWRVACSVQFRVVMTMGLIAGFGAIGTTAAWTDTATVVLPSFSTGTLDLTINGDKETQGQGGTHTMAGFKLNDILPGESVATELIVANEGTVGFSYDISARMIDSDVPASGSHLMLELWSGEPTNQRADVPGTRRGTCADGVGHVKTHLSKSGTTIPNFTNKLAPNDKTRYCMIVRLDEEAPNTYQGKSGTIQLTIDAEQLRHG